MANRVARESVSGWSLSSGTRWTRLSSLSHQKRGTLPWMSIPLAITNCSRLRYIFSDGGYKRLISQRKRIQRQSIESESVPTPSVRSPSKATAYTTMTYIEDIGQTHAVSLIVSLISENPYESRFVDSVGFLLVCLTCVAWKSTLHFLRKLAKILPQDPDVPFLGIFPKDVLQYCKDTCLTVFIVARTWKQPRCPSTGEWIKKIWFIYTMECSLAIKNKNIMNFAGKWVYQTPSS